MQLFSDHLLSIIIFLPIAGALIIMTLPKAQETAVRYTALAFTALPLGLILYAYTLFDPGRMNFEERFDWMPRFGIEYHVGLDKLSFPLVFTSALLAFVCVIISWNIKRRPKELNAVLLFIATSLFGVFSVLDYVLFYIFWDLVLVPMYFLIGIWGGPRREYASIKFFIYTFLGGVFMIPAFLGLYFTSGANTFDMMTLAQFQYPLLVQILVFIGFFFAFAVKVPLVPFHTWLPAAHVEAPTAGSVLLAGALLKMGVYGFMRVFLPPNLEETFTCATYKTTACEAYMNFLPLLALGAAVGIVYGAIVAMGQSDLKRLVAYSSIGHMAFAMLGVASGEPWGVKGAIFLMVAHGMITGLMFAVVGSIYDRTKTFEIAKLKGLSEQTPVLSGIFSFDAFASMGLPGLPGFWGELMILGGVMSSPSIRSTPFILAAIAGVIITASYFIWTLQRINLGKVPRQLAALKDVNKREIAALGILVMFILIMGIFPSSVLNLL